LKISRRGFLKLAVGATATAVIGIGAWILGTVPGRATWVSAFPTPYARTITMSVNGKDTTLQVKTNTTLLSVLRSDLKLTGTKPGCLNSECGACTVLMDGAPIYSCHKLAVEADGHDVTTVEGISSGSKLSALQRAFVDEGAFQCGFCTPGFIMTSTALLASNPIPTDSEVRRALSGNICRCGSYPHIIKAVLAAASGE
jgi:aerobic-type carbon monoxide dehydrogenase small subunit (CoxS/CutS family)